MFGRASNTNVVHLVAIITDCLFASHLLLPLVNAILPVDFYPTSRRPCIEAFALSHKRLSFTEPGLLLPHHSSIVQKGH